jgi:transcriptional regulator with XRE-family HTH domain
VTPERNFMEALSGNLAANLRYLRERRGLTQAQLARHADLPRSTVSQMETGAGNPTLSVLVRLARALDVSIEELLSSPHSAVQIFRKGELPLETRGPGGGARVAKLLPDPIPGMEIDRIELSAGTRMAGIPHRPGTREFLACESGRLTLWTGGDRHELAPGDVAAFQGDQPHSYGNEGATAAVGFSVVTLVPSAVARRAED